MICAACGVQNPDGFKFCGGCGSALASGCPNCGAELMPGFAFCGSCGTRLDGATAEPAAAAAAAPPPVAASERRLVSVLFADLVGFTTLSQSRDPEIVRELLSRYFDTCRRLIGLYGGTVEKFIGDAVMAVWGTPVATEDDAERAVRAALDLVAAVSALGDEAGIDELRARAGVMTGEAAVTVGAEGQGMVAGDMVNTASRIQSTAEPGRVLVGDATRRATEPTVVYEDAGSHELQGKAGLHRLWRAMRVVSGARGALKSEGLEAPFVGRDRELRQIKDLFHASSEEGRSHLVSVIGPAGIGKSRLVWEFYKYFDGLPQIVYWHRGRCLSYGEGVTYWALADMVRMRCRIAEDDAPEAAAAKLAEVLDTHVTDADERRFVEPRVAHLLGLDETGKFDREDLFAAWRTFFERLADLYPTVLAFEDMQWADASLLDFIEYLLEWSRRSPLYVITAARPELVERRETWGAGKRNFTSLYLEPLTDGAMRDLLAGLVPGLPDTLLERILGRAEGVPLYAVETVRMLLDRGDLVLRGSVYEPAAEVERLEVPETLHALIAARLDGLRPEERHVVQRGSVLGKTFSRPALIALADMDDTALEAALATLVRKEVLSIQADPRSPEHGQYGFLQDLMRHVAYEGLSRRERHALHMAAAAHLEAAGGDEDEIVEVLASHYLNAYEVAPDEDVAARVRVQARSLVIRAAERAESLGAPGEACRYHRRAAELADDPLEQAGHLDRAGRMATRAAALDDAAALFDRAIELYELHSDERVSSRVSARRAHVEHLTGHLSDAIERMERAYAVLSQGEPDEDLAWLAVRLATSVYFVGDVERSARLADESLNIAEALGLREVIASGWITKAMIGASGRRPEEARGLFGLALDLATHDGFAEQASRASANLSDLAFRRDRYEEALAHLDRAAALAGAIGNRPVEWFVTSERTYPLFVLGRWDDALACYADLPEDQLTAAGTLLSPLSSILEIHLHRGDEAAARRLYALYARLEHAVDVQEQSCYAGATACLLHFEGRHAEALEAARRSVAAADTLGADGQDVKQGMVWGLEAAAALGDGAQLDALLRAVDEIPPGLRAPSLEAHAHRIRARTAGDADEARRHFAAAEAGFAELGMVFWLAVTRLEQAEAAAAVGTAAGAAPLLEAAAETFGRLGAAPWLERAAQAGAVAPASASS